MGYKAGTAPSWALNAQKQMGWGAPWLPRKPLLGSMHSTLQARLPPGCSSQLSQGAWGWGWGKQVGAGPMHTVLLEKYLTPIAPAGSALGEGELTPDP